MEIKGDIGEEVLIKGVIEEIIINKEEGIKYTIKIDGFEPKSFKDDVLVFDAKEVKKPVDKPVVEPEVRRGPGRPKKTTVDDLVKKCIKDK
jgi:hypothetical protein